MPTSKTELVLKSLGVLQPTQVVLQAPLGVPVPEVAPTASSKVSDQICPYETLIAVRQRRKMNFFIKSITIAFQIYQ